MTELNLWASRLKELLRSDLEPVGVRFFSRGEKIPKEIATLEPEQGVKSYCRGLTLAARGGFVFGGREKLGCVLGTAALGLEQDPEPLLSATVREKYGAGLFGSEEASRQSVTLAPRFEPGINQAVLIGPLAQFPVEPDVVILEVNPEQTMWLLYGTNFINGGPQSLPQSGGVAGGCADITVLPSVRGEANVTFLGLGCRLKSGIPADHLQFGLPAARLAEVMANLEKMAQPMAMLAKAGAGTGK